VHVADQRVDLDQGRVLGDEDIPQPANSLGHRLGHLRRESRGLDDLNGLAGIDAGDRVHRHLGQRLRCRRCHLLDIHPALHAGHREEGAMGAVEDERQVVLRNDVARRCHQHAVHGVTFDVHAKDRRRFTLRLLRRGGQLNAAGLAATPGLDLCFDDDAAAELRGSGMGLLARRDDATGQHRDAVGAEQIPRLIFVQIHAVDPIQLPRTGSAPAPVGKITQS
jgi:hypothetical protein